jgi:arylsulfatase A-like enzyme
MTLYDTEVHVPLLIIPPAGSKVRKIVKEAVSLRDIAATVVEVAGVRARSPFQGDSLARFWNRAGPSSPTELASALPSLAEVVPDPRKHDDRAPRFPQAAIKDTHWSYIRREVDGSEKLFDLREDPKEQHDLAALPSSRAQLEKMRAALDRMTGGPLSPRRFSR